MLHFLALVFGKISYYVCYTHRYSEERRAQEKIRVYEEGRKFTVLNRINGEHFLFAEMISALSPNLWHFLRTVKSQWWVFFCSVHKREHLSAYIICVDRNPPVQGSKLWAALFYRLAHWWIIFAFSNMVPSIIGKSVLVCDLGCCMLRLLFG